ncbi:uncharacterized protein BDR25DRAFT_348822 [Lindgomyces ingoldianus]|uniref:Uncharacterized protein n=1 Tax=Lindgomyces ingoldianus TaxID=673940 RepID=A0ACB6RDR5_9PLEO|nr:uncharacterized protein BDR25DRAFT_348822 [Lindgomyces ingoldianus]KAF2476888.1 hypothetical protein BDR25DRAFT_348822 [Lindgomyces ingoldianus]
MDELVIVCGVSGVGEGLVSGQQISRSRNSMAVCRTEDDVCGRACSESQSRGRREWFQFKPQFRQGLVETIFYDYLATICAQGHLTYKMALDPAILYMEARLVINISQLSPSISPSPSRALMPEVFSLVAPITEPLGKHEKLELELENVNKRQTPRYAPLNPLTSCYAVPYFLAGQTQCNATTSWTFA